MLEQIGPRVDLVRLDLIGLGLLEELGDLAVVAPVDKAVAARIGHRIERDRRLGPRVLVLRDQGTEVEIAEHVAVQDEKAIAEHVLGEADRAGGPAGVGLLCIADLDAGLELRERPLHLLGQEAAGDDHVVHPVALEPVDHVGDVRAAGQREHRLRDRVGQGPQASALAAGQDQRLHLNQRSACSASLPRATRTKARSAAPGLPIAS